MAKNENTIIHISPSIPMLGMFQQIEPALASTSGTAAPIVWFKQFKNDESTQLGRGVSGALVSFDKAAVSL